MDSPSSSCPTPILAGDDISPEQSRPLETLDADKSDAVSTQETQNNSEPSTSSYASNVAEPELSLQSSEALAKGISSLLGSLIKDFDCKAENASKSQDQLCSSIDRLTRELDQLLEDAPLPCIMQHAARISGVRKRVSSLNSLLKSIQRRIDNIDQMLSASLSHGKATAENVTKHE
ncbi:uncharacterized protein LOC122069579 [Macadamia integrifolia]|uniref:uncharacterized protein LOC122069579 n=1 Tax=Macadamia integrifolia TaxID=60698 RepID=UPI001C4F7372|nr:uncharacterized protein LOC122069579 [Macadamia integrifolia]XP_042489566.1 uncharacterized protein LOC122069579 [Macadamia integrifolia]